MTQKRQTGLQLTMLAIAMAALVILSAVGPAACAPAAPAEQASGQAEAEDATAEPTASATTDATNTPTPEPTGVSTATATPTPSPTPTPDPKLDRLLNIWSQGYEAQQSAGQGASGQSAGGQSATQKTIAVQIAPAYQDTDHRSSITAFLDSRGIAHMTVVGNNDIQATVPVSLLATLTGLPGVGSILANPLPYPNAGGVNILIAEYEAGLLPGEDANPTFARLGIGIEGNANYDAVKRYLKNNGAVMAYSDSDNDEAYRPAGLLVAYVPVAKIGLMARMAGVELITLDHYPVPPEYRVTQPPVLGPTPTPTPSVTPTLNPKLDNILNIWAQGYEAQQSADQGPSGQSAGGQSATQKTIAVQIAPAYQDTDHRSSITAFLDSRGIAHMTVVGNNDIQATVPVSLLATLTGLPGVGSILANPLPYPNASGVNILIAEYEAGLLPGEDANPTFALLDIGIEGDANYDAVKRYLENNGAVMFYSDPDINDTYKPIGSLPVYVPVAQIAPVAQMDGVFDMTLHAYPVPTERRVTQPPLPGPAATPTPTPTAAAQSGASPAAACEGGAPALPSVL